MAGPWGQGPVRAAITAALRNANLPMVGTIYPSRAYIGETDYAINASLAYVESTDGSGAVLVVNLGGPDKRMRKTLTGRGAVDDTNIHLVTIEVFFASTGGEPVPAQADYDIIIDALVPFIRGNPTMSAPETVWSAGEYQAGVVHRASEPFTDQDGTTVFIYGTVRFEAWEWVAGPAGT